MAKTDRIDAEVIARAALRMPHTLRPLAEEAPRAAAARLLASQLDFCTRSRTHAKNRLRAVLLEADPALEAAVRPLQRLADGGVRRDRGPGRGRRGRPQALQGG